MAFKLPDGVWETTTTTSTGAYTLAGAVSPFVTFGSVLADGDTVEAAVYMGSEREEGKYTYNSGTNTLSRTEIYYSTNANAAVNWGAGTKQVVVAPLGAVFGSFRNPGSTGIPVRTDNTTWSYKATVGTGDVVLATDPVFQNSYGLGNDIVYDYESSYTVGVFTDEAIALNGFCASYRYYSYYTDASNYEGWYVGTYGAGGFQISHQQSGSYIGNTRDLALGPSNWLLLSGGNGFRPTNADNSKALGDVAGYGFNKLVLSETTAPGTPTAPADAVFYVDSADGLFKTKMQSGNVQYRQDEAGLLPVEQFILNNGNTYTLTSQTAAQKAFNSPTNGAITLPVGLYEFEGYFELSSLSATSGSFGFALAGTATKTQHWTSTALKTAAGAAGATAQTTHNTSNANTTLITANTTTSGWFRVQGTFRITAAGTVIPQISLGVAAAAVVSALSYFKVKKIGNETVRSIGPWT